MDFIKNLANNGGNSQNNGNNRANNEVDTSNHGQSAGQNPSTTEPKSEGSFFGGLADKFNNAAGGGRESEKNEDYLDKGVDFVQEKFLGQGAQDNETAVEQAKDEQISDFIRGKYRSVAGSDIPIKDKPTTFDRNAD